MGTNPETLFFRAVSAVESGAYCIRVHPFFRFGTPLIEVEDVAFLKNPTSSIDLKDTQWYSIFDNEIACSVLLFLWPARQWAWGSR